MDVLTTSVNSRRPSVTSMLRSRTVAGWKRHKRLVTPLLWNGFSAITSLFFVTDRKIAFLESVNFSTYGDMPIFNFRDGHATTFRHHSEAYICQMPVHRLPRLAKGTPSASAFQSVPLVWVKTVSCSLCAG